MGRRGDGGGVGKTFLMFYGLRFVQRAGVCNFGARNLTCMWWLGVLVDNIEMDL